MEERYLLTNAGLKPSITLRSETCLQGEHVMERSVQVMFWVLFAKDNVNKPQSKVKSAEAKIDLIVMITGLHLFKSFLLVLSEEYEVQPIMNIQKHYKVKAASSGERALTLPKS